jgi:phosphodiesterase/alkaline phosphatase D-like protein
MLGGAALSRVVPGMSLLLARIAVAHRGSATMTTAPTASVSDTTARIGFRAAGSTTVAIKYSTSSDLSGATTTDGVSVDSSTDYTGAIDISSLTADTAYYYTPVVGGVAQYSSDFPTFKTFPASGEATSFSFAFGSCTKHGVQGADSIFAEVPSSVSFLMHLGDTIYADSDTPAASTLSDYRGKHRAALTGADTNDAGWKTLRAGNPVFTMWDDHDITNDFSGGTGDALYAPAKQAFHEYHGRANPDPLTTDELYYTFQVGDVGFFVCDLRSFRSTNTDTDDSSKTILGATQKTALKDWLLTNKDAFTLKFICCSVPAHGYASNTAGDSWGGVDDDTQDPNDANGFRTERNEIWDYIDSEQIPGVLFLSGDQHWAGSFKTTYASRPRYEFMATPFNSPVLTEVARSADSVNGPVFWKYDAGMNFGVVTVDTTASPATVSFQLYGTSGSLGSSYLTAIDQDDIDADLVAVPGITITADLPDATVGVAYSGSVTATNTGGATGDITFPEASGFELPAGLNLGDAVENSDGSFTADVTGTPTDAGDNALDTEFSATNGTQDATLDHTWSVSAGSLWTPASLATAPEVWLNDTSALTHGSGGDCQQWNDISGNSRHFSQNQVSQQPVINAAGQNSLRELDFDGSQDYLGGTNVCAALTNNAAALATFVVANPTPVAGSAFGRLLNFSVGQTNNTSVRAGIWLSGSQIRAYQRRLDSNSAAFAGSAYASKAWHLIASEHDWTAASVALRIDGADSPTTTATGQGSGNTSATDSTAVTIGGANDVGTQYVTSGIGEVIVLGYVPGTSDRQKIEGYLAWKWGLEGNLPSGHPYKAAPP